MRRLRSLAGLSQAELGKRLGVTFQQVQKYESGANNVSVATLCRLRAALGCQFADFFVGLGGDAANGDAETGRHLGRVTYRLSRAVLEIRDAEVQERLIRLVQAMAGRC
jgi:transcriptional regulator with XRE-family HTH domain